MVVFVIFFIALSSLDCVSCMAFARHGMAFVFVDWLSVGSKLPA